MTLSGDRTVNVQNSITTVANSLNDGSARTLTKSGTGSLVVTGSAAHGGSIVTAGVLAVTGTYSSTGNMNVQGGVLGLNSTLTRNLGSAASQVQLTAGNSGFAATGTNATWGNAANNLLVAIGGTAAPTALTFGGTSTFLASGQTLVLGAAISNGTVTFANSLNLANATQTIQVNRSTATGAGTDAIISGTISNGSLTKTGEGRLLVSAANTYAGTTTVNAGTLLVSNSTGSGLGTGNVIVNNGGKIGGSGSFTGALTVVSGGTLSPGSSIETLGSGTLTFNTGSTYEYEIDSSVGLPVGADLQKVTGGLNLSGTVTLTLVDLASSPVLIAQNTVFSLINYTGSWNAGLFTFGGNAIVNGTTFTAGLNIWRLDYNAADGGANFSTEYFGGSDSFVNITAVPAPGTTVLFGLGSAFMLWNLRRRRS